jgi:hypothetical protein
VSGALNTATLNTGQGNNELYPMNQDMSTNASVQFATLDVGMYMLSLFNEVVSFDPLFSLCVLYIYIRLRSGSLNVEQLHIDDVPFSHYLIWAGNVCICGSFAQ